jgi:3-phenylpropionate/cinnamic acid dioxygenase small subunit
MSDSLRQAVEDFLYYEAELLDERRFHDWLDLFTDDAKYWMPVRDNRLTLPGAVSEELAAPGDNAYFDDTKETLRLRVERLYTGADWAETPPSRTRHLVTNIRIKRDSGGEVEVHSNFLVYRSRLEDYQDQFVGSRVDVLRREADQFRIASRTIVFDQAMLAARNISIFL